MSVSSETDSTETGVIMVMQSFTEATLMMRGSRDDHSNAMRRCGNKGEAGRKVSERNGGTDLT
jgi:hypothetical protein